MLFNIVTLVVCIGIFLVGLFFYFIIWLTRVLHLDSLELKKRAMAGDRTSFDTLVLEGFRQQTVLLKWRMARFARNWPKDDDSNSNDNDTIESVVQIITDEDSLIYQGGGHIYFVRHRYVPSTEGSIEKELLEEEVDLELGLSTKEHTDEDKETFKEARCLYWIGVFLQSALCYEVLGNKLLVAERDRIN